MTVKEYIANSSIEMIRIRFNKKNYLCTISDAILYFGNKEIKNITNSTITMLTV